MKTQTSLVGTLLILFLITTSQTTFAPPNGEGIIDLSNLLNYADPPLPEGVTYRHNNSNPVTDNGATLGRILFYDKKLSVNNTTSCGSCHQQENAFGDNRQVSIGFNGTPTARHSMRLVNVDFHDDFAKFWDRRVNELENVVTLPLKDTIEMGFSGLNGFPGIDSLLTKMQAEKYYAQLFTAAYGDSQITERRIALALAQFIRSIVTFDSKFDEGYWENRNEQFEFSNFTEQENNGKRIFLGPSFGVVGDSPRKGGNCGFCHRVPNLSIIPFSTNNGVIGVAGKDSTFFDISVKRSPSIKNAVKPDGSSNGPFMHDGSLATLEEVIDHYNHIPFDPRNAEPFSLLSPLPNGNVELRLTEEDKADLLVFLKTLSGPDLYINEKWSNPFDTNGNLKVINAPFCDAVDTEMSISVCEGNSWEGYSLSGTYVNTYDLSPLCDSTRTLHLTVLPQPKKETFLSICQGENYNGWTETGAYTSRLTASSGCDTLQTIFLEVLSEQDSACMTTSSTELSEPDFTLTVFPNPATTQIWWQALPIKTENITVFNSVGAIIFQSSQARQSFIDVQDFPSGIYWLRLGSRDGDYLTKFIKY